MSSFLRRHAVAVVVVATLVPMLACLLTIVVIRVTQDEPLCDRAAGAAKHRRSVNTGEGPPTVVVIGDSFAIAPGLDSLESWPVRLPGRVHVDAFSGSGFSATASPCGAVSYADRAERAVTKRGRALVVVEGGLNDVWQSDEAIEQGFRALMRELDGHRVLIVGPAPAPTRADLVPRVDALLADLSAEADVPYLSMADVQLDYLEDRLHPSVAGQAVFGDVVARTVAPMLGLVHQPAEIPAG